ncbi:MAG TPA: T9SS type A sorting domain-containing protein, partial [Saprospiraceae bacterium]|nr:T9SS type A sorting domain-containing protein [Saprospiraceae bacterium]
FSGNSSFNLAIAVADLPSGILDSLGVPTGLFDSIRIRLTIDRTDFVDAFGTCAIPGGTYDVLRVKRTDYQDMHLEIHIPFLGWQDVTDLLGAAGFGADTTITYNFLSNTAKEPIAVLTMDTTGVNVVQVDYKDNGIQIAVEPVIQNQMELIISPNPVSNTATFTLKNIEPGQYTLHLVNMNGQRVWSKEINSVSEQVSLEKLSSGIYLYQLLDASQQMKVAGKVVKE